jgi:hypothetical protein
MAIFKLTYRFTWYGEMEERWICDFWEPEIMVLKFLYVERSGTVSFDSVDECELWARWFLEQQRPDSRPSLSVLINEPCGLGRRLRSRLHFRLSRFSVCH